MNLIEFLKQVDEITQQDSKEQLRQVIHNIAREISEERRLEFLEKLTQENTESQELLTPEILEEIKRVKEELNEINQEDRVLIEELDEGYDSWYDSGEEFYYEDPSNIQYTLSRAFDLVNKLFDYTEYKMCCSLASDLMDLECGIESDFESRIVSLDELLEKLESHLNLKDLLLKLTYSTYKTESLEDVADLIYRINYNFSHEGFTLERFLQYSGEEIEEVDLLLKKIIEIVKEENDSISSKLLQEALDLRGNSEDEIQIAREKINTDPEFIYHILCKDNISDSSKIELGFEVLQEMNKNYTIRSKIALLVAECILKTGEKMELLNYCYKESFYSDTNATNLLRMLLNSTETKSILINEAKSIINEKLSENDTKGRNYNIPIWTPNNIYIKINSLTKEEAVSLRFLCGDFDKVLNNDVAKSPSLGWSYTFNKIAVPMYSFLIYKNNNLPNSFVYDLSNIAHDLHFSSQNYLMGLDQENKNDLFLEVLKQWKQLFTVSEELKEKIISVLDTVMVERVHAIMENNRRNYYSECARFIDEIAIAKHVLDPNFNPNTYLYKFQDMYPRRRNFVRDLKHYIQ